MAVITTSTCTLSPVRLGPDNLCASFHPVDNNGVHGLAHLSGLRTTFFMLVPNPDVVTCASGESRLLLVDRKMCDLVFGNER